jgi:mannose-6-phosphate isomerase-like protein (cupin superfamily)
VSGRPQWRASRLEDLERRDRGVPVREYLGIRSFGINAFDAGEDGRLIGEHDETATGQEELYLVLDGTAIFEVDGETFEATAGTFVFAPPESKRKATGDATVLAIGATPGRAYQGIDWGESWRFHSDSMAAYGEQRYADALQAVRDGLEHAPDNPALHFNYACFATLAGEVDDETFSHLRRSAELSAQLREQARVDDDLAALREDPRFEHALQASGVS